MDPAIEYAVNKPLLPEQVAHLFSAAGLRRPVNDLERIARMLAHANLTLSAWYGEVMVGIARSVTDFSFCCYLSDLAVLPAYQGMGIGKALLARTRAEVGDECMVLLLSVPEATAYYSRLGMQRSERAFVFDRAR